MSQCVPALDETFHKAQRHYDPDAFDARENAEEFTQRHNAARAPLGYHRKAEARAAEPSDAGEAFADGFGR